MAPVRNVVAELLDWLRELPDCVLGPGLSAAELDRAEGAVGVTIPPLWRAVLARACPVARAGSGAHYPDWRLIDEPAVRALVDAPVRGLLFDVEHNDFWWHAWGAAPEPMAERLSLARRRLAEVPRLTPLRHHWYVGPEDDSPVFSIVQADLYVPALSLADLPTGRSQRAVPTRQWPIGSVPFWSELHAYAQLGHHPELGFAQLGRGGL
ncbi:hypothetical protein MOQ72_38075 [Saccharopolyspora sp. K220]|uniref:hypothetical protein n=1 Tax=Saccharopolyspora soli TaxID=2926618 RepID=UPI001F59B43E|nr:hypothetical protein [Saccharopolyspora soli]MCI2423244.1 hypothetical protein [Saccharopolyspora soli]